MNVTPDSETVHAAPVPAAGRDVRAHAGGHAGRVLRAALAVAAALARQRLQQHAVARRPHRLRRRRPRRRRVGPARRPRRPTQVLREVNRRTASLVLHCLEDATDVRTHGTELRLGSLDLGSELSLAGTGGKL